MGQTNNIPSHGMQLRDRPSVDHQVEGPFFFVRFNKFQPSGQRLIRLWASSLSVPVRRIATAN